MKKTTCIQATSLTIKPLTPAQSANVKGGASFVAVQAVLMSPAPEAVVSILSDDKRRERPGGGVSTQ